MIRLEVSVTGMERATRQLGVLVSSMRDLRPVWKALRPMFQLAAERRFKAEGASDGGKWTALSPEYAARKAVTHPGRSILVRDGDLLASLVAMGGAGQVYRETTTSFTWGTEDPSAVYHQFGTGRMPRREILRVTPVDELAIVAVAGNVIGEAAMRAGA